MPARFVLNELYNAGGSIVCAHATTVLVESLLRRGTDNDVQEA